jgi:hypothetical protein
VFKCTIGVVRYQHPHIVRYAAENVRGNRDLMARAIIADAPGTISYATGDVLADAEVMLSAAKQSPDLLSYAAESLKADKTFVRRVATAVAPSAVLQYAAEGLGDDKDFVLECMSLAGDSFSYVSERLRGDREVFDIARQSIGDSGKSVCVCNADVCVYMHACTLYRFVHRYACDYFISGVDSLILTSLFLRFYAVVNRTSHACGCW